MTNVDMHKNRTSGSWVVDRKDTLTHWMIPEMIDKMFALVLR